MQKINEVIDFFKNITSEQIRDIVIAIVIITFFRIFSASFSYIIIKMFKIKSKKDKKIKNSAFYEPLKSFFSIFGIYLAILFLQPVFNISDNIINIITKTYKIIIILTTAKGFSYSLNLENVIISKLIQNNKEFDDITIKYALRIIKAIIYVIAGFLIITELGFDLNGIVAGLGIGSVVITLAAQDTAKNLFGGLVIFMDKPFAIGDYIKVNTFEGTVEDIAFRSTKVRTLENSVVCIPNSTLASSSIDNCSKITKRRYETLLTFEIDTKLEKMEEAKLKIEKCLNDTNSIIKDTISVNFSKISANGYDVSIVAYSDLVDKPEFLKIKEQLNYQIMNIVNDMNLQLAYNTQTILLKN